MATRDANAERRRAALRAAWLEVTTGRRIRLTSTITIPANLVVAGCVLSAAGADGDAAGERPQVVA